MLAGKLPSVIAGAPRTLHCWLPNTGTVQLPVAAAGLMALAPGEHGASTRAKGCRTAMQEGTPATTLRRHPRRWLDKHVKFALRQVQDYMASCRQNKLTGRFIC